MLRRPSRAARAVAGTGETTCGRTGRHPGLRLIRPIHLLAQEQESSPETADRSRGPGLAAAAPSKGRAASRVVGKVPSISSPAPHSRGSGARTHRPAHRCDLRDRHSVELSRDSRRVSRAAARCPTRAARVTARATRAPALASCVPALASRAPASASRPPAAATRTTAAATRTPESASRAPALASCAPASATRVPLLASDPPARASRSPVVPLTQYQ